MPRGDKDKYTDKQKAQGGAYRGKFEKPWRARRRSRAPRLGDREQGVRRRQQVRLGTRQARHPCLFRERRQTRRRRIRERTAAERSASAKKAAETRKRNKEYA